MNTIENDISKAKYCFIANWIRDNLEESAIGSCQRESLYQSFSDACQNSQHTAPTPASFGKMIRCFFPKVGTRRLGCRGQSKYHYIGIALKNADSHLYIHGFVDLLDRLKAKKTPKRVLEMTIEQKVAFEVVIDRIEKVFHQLEPQDFWKVYPQLHVDCIQFIHEFTNRNKSDYIEISSFHWIIEIDLILASSIFSYIFKTLLVDLKSNLPYLKDIKKVSSTFAMGLKLMPGDHPLVKLKYHVIKALSKSLDLIFMFVDISMTFSNVLENSELRKCTILDFETCDFTWIYPKFKSEFGVDEEFKNIDGILHGFIKNWTTLDQWAAFSSKISDHSFSPLESIETCKSNENLTSTSTIEKSVETAVDSIQETSVTSTQDPSESIETDKSTSAYEITELKRYLLKWSWTLEQIQMELASSGISYSYWIETAKRWIELNLKISKSFELSLGECEVGLMNEKTRMMLHPLIIYELYDLDYFEYY